mmetsp:Transcript_25366/g.50549  ORF Transcript_25366/g.50549 Transcript_25366/m.50549 type:complete len:109 (-) Transcript_25366:1029-1355(-)
MLRTSSYKQDAFVLPSRMKYPLDIGHCSLHVVPFHESLHSFLKSSYVLFYHHCVLSTAFPHHLYRLFYLCDSPSGICGGTFCRNESGGKIRRHRVQGRKLPESLGYVR